MNKAVILITCPKLVFSLIRWLTNDRITYSIAVWSMSYRFGKSDHVIQSTTIEVDDDFSIKKS